MSVEQFLASDEELSVIIPEYDLMRSAANDNLFKLFSYIPFWLQKYITTQLKTNLI